MHKIGIISDTHNLLRTSVTNILRTCDIILHCGDLHTAQILEQLKAIAPVYAVRGNADKQWADSLPQTLSAELFGIRLFMIHNKNMIQEDIHDRDLIIYGHSHKYEMLRQNNQIWLNPGSCGKKRFLLPVTMAVLSIPNNGPFRIDPVTLNDGAQTEAPAVPQANMKRIVIYVMKETDKGKSVETIAKNGQIRPELAEQICRLYLTHPGVSADGILGKMGL